VAGVCGGTGYGKPVAENMKSRLLTTGGKFIAKKIDSQLHLSKGRQLGQLLCFAMVMPRPNELIGRRNSFHSSQTFSEF